MTARPISSSRDGRPALRGGWPSGSPLGVRRHVSHLHPSSATCRNLRRGHHALGDDSSRDWLPRMQACARHGAGRLGQLPSAAERSAAMGTAEEAPAFLREAAMRRR